MIDLTGKTQDQVEEMFSTDSVKETLQLGVDMFYNQVEDEDLEELRELTQTQDVDDLMLHLIALVGNPEMGSKKYDPENGEKVRMIHPVNLAKALGSSYWLENIYPDPEERFPKALEIIALMDDILYDIRKVRTLIQDEQWRMIPQCLIRFEIDMTLAQIAELNMFKFPVLDTPNDWKTNQSGGYWLSNDKCTLNRGASEQPQECLDVLNTLQRNTFALVNANQQDYQDYFYTKMLKKYTEYTAASITKNVTLTSGIVFDTMKSYEFHFEWKFDFRGRMYSTGYDVNLQGDKYHKGTVYPTMKNFKETKC